MEIVKCWDTIQGRYIMVEVDDKVAQELRRSYWREHKSEERYYNRLVNIEPTLLSSRDSVEDELLRQEQKYRLRNAIQMLSESDSYLIVSYYFEEKPIRVLAEERGVSQSYMCRLLKNSRSRLLAYYNALV